MINIVFPNLRSWVDGKLQFRFLSIVNRQSLHEEGSESGAGATPEAVKDEKSLESRALVGQLPNSVQDQVHYLLPDSVVTSGIVVGCIFLAYTRSVIIYQYIVYTVFYYFPISRESPSYL